MNDVGAPVPPRDPNEPQDVVPSRSAYEAFPDSPMAVIGPDGIAAPGSADVARREAPPPVTGPGPDHAALERRLPPAESTLFAVFGDCRRSGPFRMPAQLTAVGMFGDVKLDLREALVEHEVVELRSYTAFGDVTLIVPPGYDVQVRGFNVFGDTKQHAGAAPRPDAEHRTVVVHNYGAFGDVTVRTLAPGEIEPTLWNRLRGRVDGGR